MKVIESLKNFEGLDIPSFEDEAGKENFYAHKDPTTMQVNIGNICNIACKHCHVNASPAGKNVISEEVRDAIIQALEKHPFRILDVTGGAPEMMPGFEDFILRAKDHVDQIMVRTNLCILTEEEYSHLPAFYAENDISLVASLPSTGQSITDRQRGRGVYDASVEALKRLNGLGYGTGDHELNLVFNPNGAILPPDQDSLEKRYKEELFEEHGIHFDNLLAITNNPIGRFGDFLVRSDQMEDYMDTLYEAYNQATVDSIMCKDMVSVSWDGRLYDCDFNQAADLEIEGQVKTIFDLAEKGLEERPIAVDYHCYGCTAGSGSSCGGSLD